MSTDISVIELKKRLDNQESINLIDVREQYEFDEFKRHSNSIGRSARKIRRNRRLERSRNHRALQVWRQEQYRKNVPYLTRIFQCPQPHWWRHGLESPIWRLINKIFSEAKAPHWRHFSLPFNLGFIRNLGM